MPLKNEYSSASSNFSKLGLVVFLFGLLAFSSCRKDEDGEDTMRPEIEILSTAPERSSGVVCEAPSDIILKINNGESVEISVEVTDDVALGSLKFDIHNNFDCHGHKSNSKSTIWSYIEIVELSGTSEVVVQTLQSPDDVVPGNYHLGIMALDEVGREAEMRYFDLVVQDPSDTLAPTIVFNEPVQGAKHPLGAPLEISCTAEDENSLDAGEYEMTLISPQGLEFSIAREEFPEGTGNSNTFTETYSIPGFVSAGVCTLQVSVTDWRNNEARIQQTFELVD